MYGGNDIDNNERNAKLSIGVVPQELILDPFFTPRETLEYQSGYYGVPKKENCVEEILESVGLLDKADAYARSLSGGMRRRLMIGKAMVHRPPILIILGSSITGFSRDKTNFSSNWFIFFATIGPSLD